MSDFCIILFPSVLSLDEETIIEACQLPIFIREGQVLVFV